MEIGDISHQNIPRLNPASTAIFLCEGLPDAYWIPKINNEEDVCIGRSLGTKRTYLRCDFEKIKEQQPVLKKITPELMREHFEKTGKIEQHLPQLSEGERFLIYNLCQASMIAKGILGTPEETKREASLMKYFDPTQNCEIKPLSECKGLAACSEYAILSQYILLKAGIESSVIIGAIFIDGEIIPHTYLTTDNGNYVLDPLRTALEENCWPPKIYKAGKPMTTDFLQESAKRSFLCMPCKGVISGSDQPYGF